MNCLDFRRRWSTEPGRDDPDLETHMAQCGSCTAFAVEMESVDHLLSEALRLPVPDSMREFSVESLESGAGKAKSSAVRWMAMAASIVAAALVSYGAWRTASVPDDIAAELLAHLLHEPAALLETADIVPADQVEYVLRRTGARLEEPLGKVTYIKNCPFRNQRVAHIVIQGSAGPVTLMLLPHVDVDAATPFEEQGYKGTIVPVGSGSVAIIGGEDEPLAPVEELVSSAVAWRI